MTELDTVKLSESAQRAVSGVSEFAYVFKKDWSEVAKKDPKPDTRVSKTTLFGSVAIDTTQDVMSDTPTTTITSTK